MTARLARYKRIPTATSEQPRSSDIVFQPHPIDPPHEVVLRSLELIATDVAPALGWAPRA